MESVGNRLIQLREERGLNRVEFAKVLNVNKSTITRYETGAIKPNLDMMIEITKKFNVTLDWLAGIDNTISANYEPIVKECIKENVSPEQLKQLMLTVKALKG